MWVPQQRIIFFRIVIYDQGRGARELASWGKEKSKENCY